MRADRQICRLIAFDPDGTLLDKLSLLRAAGLGVARVIWEILYGGGE